MGKDKHLKNYDMKEQPFNEITRKIIGCSYEVSNTLGIGFVEKVYENALTHLCRKIDLSVSQQYPIKVKFDGITIGNFFADLLIEKRVLVELKAVPRLLTVTQPNPLITFDQVAWKSAC